MKRYCAGKSKKMIPMLDTSDPLEQAEAEIGCPVEQLITPLTRFNRQRLEAMFAIDNGAFSGFKANAFLSLLAREWENRHLCRFVCAPDVVVSAIRTIECFQEWRHRLCGWKVALVMQDGLVECVQAGSRQGVGERRLLRPLRCGAP